ncbi:hypothetical protein A2U01_0111843, partial [Trifolium medium]|nr:hypothetical protein [Trifolium medium]
PSPEAWQEHRRVDRLEYEAIMDRNEAVFYEQYGVFEAQRKAQKEARAAAAATRSPAFTYSELGLDDPGE